MLKLNSLFNMELTENFEFNIIYIYYYSTYLLF